MNIVKKKKRNRLLTHKGLVSALRRFRTLEHAVQWYTFPIWEGFLNERDANAVTAFFDRALRCKVATSRFVGNQTLPHGSGRVTQKAEVYLVKANPLLCNKRFRRCIGEYVCVIATQMISAERYLTFMPGRAGIVLPLDCDIAEYSVEQTMLDAIGEFPPYRLYFYWKHSSSSGGTVKAKR